MLKKCLVLLFVFLLVSNITIYAFNDAYEVTKPIFTSTVSDMFVFSDGLAYVNGYYDENQNYHIKNGFINIFGEYVIVLPEEYNEFICTYFHDNCAYIVPVNHNLKEAVAKIDRYGNITKLTENSIKEQYINSNFTQKIINNVSKLFYKGNEVKLPFECDFVSLGNDSAMYCAINSYDNNYGLVTNKGKVYPCEYAYIHRLDKDIYKLEDKSGKISYVDSNLNKVSALDNKEISQFKNGLAYYTTDDKSVIINKSYAIEFTLNYKVVDICAKDSYIAYNYKKVPSDNRISYGIIDSQSNIKVPFIYNQIYDTEIGYYLAADNENTYLIDEKYEIVKVFKQTIVSSYAEGDNYFLSYIDLDDTRNTDVVFFDGTVIKTEYNFMSSGGRILYSGIWNLASKYAPPKNGFYITDSAPSDWAKPSVEEAIKNNIIPPDLQNLYKESITRKDFCQLIIKYLETYLEKDYNSIINDYSIDVSINKFIDTNDRYVILCNKLGIVNGKSSDRYAPYDLLTREEACAILTNMLLKISPQYLSIYNESAYSDNQLISAWAKYAVNIISSNDIIKGKLYNKFAPKDNITREEACIIMNRLFMKKSK